MKAALGLSIVAVLLSAAALVIAITSDNSQPREAAEGLNTDALATPFDNAFPPARSDGKSDPVADDDHLAAIIDARIQKYVDEHPEVFASSKAAKGLAALARGVDWTPEELDPVDISDLSETDEKLKRILESFEGAQSYSSDNPLVHQMIGLGRDAIDPLLSMLNSKEFSGFGNWAAKKAMEDALEGLLSVDDKATVLHQFERHGHFAKLIDEYQFPESEDLVMAKFKNPMGSVGREVVDAALKLNHDRAVKVLSDYVRRGQNVSYAAEQLATIPGVDLDAVLREAARSSRMVWDQATLARLLVERGMQEGLLLAAVVLRSNDHGADHAKGQLAEIVSRLTPAQGTIGEMAVWLEGNAGNLRWNAGAGAFE